MQYANDITPLTLASTAQLREILNSPHEYEYIKNAVINREIESRSTLKRIPCEGQFGYTQLRIHN